MTLSLIITSHNEQWQEVQDTIASARDNAGADIEIIVVDDASQVTLALNDKAAILIRNQHRAGVAMSRHIGALYATGDLLFITDAHVRFEPGWARTLIARAKGRPHTAHCCTCVGLSAGMMDMKRAASQYNGATFNFFGKDANDRSGQLEQVLECVWLPKREGDDYEIPALMGACYLVPREFYLDIGGLRGLRGWGSDEALLSLKVWLAGGDIRICKQVRVGHQFRDASPYRTESWMMLYNKAFIAHTCFEPKRAKQLLSKFPRTPELIMAENRIVEDWGLVASERTYNRRIFVRSLEWLLSQFGIPWNL